LGYKYIHQSEKVYYIIPDEKWQEKLE
jgi:hypothetical protein